MVETRRAKTSVKTGRVWRWAGALAMVGMASLALSGCGGDSSDDGGSAAMALTWTFTPDPAVAQVSTEADYDWVADYRVTLQETGGQGGTITDVTVNVYENGDGEVGAGATAANTDLAYDSTRIEPRGTTELDFTTHYTFASEGRAAIIDIFIFLVDDEGRQAQVGSRLVVD